MLNGIKSPSLKIQDSGKSLKIKNSGITFGRRNHSLGNQESIMSYGMNNDGDSVDNTSTYDVLQLMSKPELQTQPVKFVNLNSLRDEQDKRMKLKKLYSDQAQKNEKLVSENEELSQ